MMLDDKSVAALIDNSTEAFVRENVAHNDAMIQKVYKLMLFCLILCKKVERNIGPVKQIFLA